MAALSRFVFSLTGKELSFKDHHQFSIQMKTCSYITYCLIFLALGCQKPEAVVEPLSVDELVAQNARVEKVITKENSYTSGIQYTYDRKGRIQIEQRLEPDIPSVTYTYKNDVLVRDVGGMYPYNYTLALNNQDFILATLDKRYIDFLSKLKYNEDGYLSEEVNSFYYSYSGATVVLKHTYSGGNRTKTVMTRANYDPDSAVVIYDYDKIRYNPNLQYDDYQLIGDGSLSSGYFADYGKFHYSLYGKSSRNLLKTATCTVYAAKNHAYSIIRTYSYSYVFDSKKRVDSLTVTSQRGIYKRKFIYKE